MLSLLHSAVRGHAGFSEGEEEECATCGTVGGELKKCLACKQVSTMCAKPPQCGAHSVGAYVMYVFGLHQSDNHKA